MPTIIFDIVLLALFLVIIIICAKRGFFKSVMRLLRLFLAVVIAYCFGKQVGALLDQKFIHGWMYNVVYDKLNSMYQSASSSFNTQKILSSFPKFLFPESMRQQIENLDETGEALVVSASESISTSLSGIISTVLGYIVVFLVALVVLLIITKIISAVIQKLPVIGMLDHILGALIGLFVSWIILSLLYFSTRSRLFCAFSAPNVRDTSMSSRILIWSFS